VGLEALIAALATGLGLFTWSHQQRQSVINSRFDSIKKRVETVEDKIEELPVKYVLKSDLNTELGDIRVWLRSINDKLDRLIMSRADEKQ
jgi:predicted nucleotide-binding protein (sugar kinase/HSP70/actin superfamily)